MKKQVLMFMYSTIDNIPPLLNEGRSLAKNEYVVRVLGLRYESTQPRVEEVVAGFTIHRMSLLTRLIFGDHDAFQAIRYAEVFLRSFLWGLFRSVDVYVGHDLVTLPYVYPLARLRRRPIIYRAHELWGEQSPGMRKDSFWKWLDRKFCPRVNALVTPESNRAAIYVDEYGATKPPTVVYNCPAFIPRPTGSTLKKVMEGKGIRGNFVVYYQGGLGTARRIDKLVEALKHTADDVSLVLVGRGSASFEGWFSRLVDQNKLSDRITYLGFVPDGPHRFELCAGANVGIMFVNDNCRNYRYHATASNKLFEYMMMGLPILATDLQSYREIVVKENVGLCVDSTDPHAIAEGIMQLYRHPELVGAMKENALRLASERFNWDVEAPKLIRLYDELSK
jgi:glycosyltransferase involved in cell wall biosynthesis